MHTPDPLAHVLNAGDTLSIELRSMVLSDGGGGIENLLAQATVLDCRTDGTMVRRRSGSYWRYAGRHGDDLLWVHADSNLCWSKPAATFWRAT